MAARWEYSSRSSDFNGGNRKPLRRAPEAVPVAAPAGERECAQGEFCASGYLGADGKRLPGRSPRALCDADRNKVEAVIPDLPRLYVALHGELGRQSQDGAAVRSPFGPRLGLRGDIDAAMRLYVEVLASWHERVAAVASLVPPPEPNPDGSPSARPGYYVAKAILALEHRVDVLVALPAEPMRRAVGLREVLLDDEVPGVVRSVYAATFPGLHGGHAGVEVLRLQRVARAILGETRERPVELLGVPCRDEDCDMLALRRAELPSDPDAPAWWSECAECGDRMTEEEYRDWTKRYARWAQGRTAVDLPSSLQ
jgi:hypothetical protein